VQAVRSGVPCATRTLVCLCGLIRRSGTPPLECRKVGCWHTSGGERFSSGSRSPAPLVTSLRERGRHGSV
jgi:hypothetical protein